MVSVALYRVKYLVFLFAIKPGFVQGSLALHQAERSASIFRINPGIGNVNIFNVRCLDEIAVIIIKGKR